MSKATSQPTHLVENLIAEFREGLSRDGLDHSTVRLYAQDARYLSSGSSSKARRPWIPTLAWFYASPATRASTWVSRGVDGLQSRRNDCRRGGSSGDVLEARDIVRHPGELAEGFRLAQLVSTSGFPSSTADTYRGAANADGVSARVFRRSAKRSSIDT